MNYKWKDFDEVPAVATVYAMYGLRNEVIYVGTSGNLKQRLTQHLINRDSSVTVAAAPAQLNPDRIKEVRWWTDTIFADKDHREAAEQIAFKFFDPVLRSRAAVSEKAMALSKDDDFKQKMKSLFRSEPAGSLLVPSLTNLYRLVEDLKREVSDLSERLSRLEQSGASRPRA